MSKRVPNFFEPWRAVVTADWRHRWGDEPPPVDDPDVLERWRSGRDKAEREAEWVIWGAGMFSPQVVTGYATGDPVVCDGDHLIARLHKIHSDRPDAVTHGQIAVRVAECVNSCRGIANPVALIDATRDLLHDLTAGQADASDPRVVSLLARWIPAVPNIADVGLESNS